jgi:hypothetical protein
LKISNAGSIRFINVYVIQTSKEKALMWTAIVDHDLNAIKRVLVGDFNMINKCGRTQLHEKMRGCHLA